MDSSKSGDEIIADFEKMDSAIKSNASAIDKNAKKINALTDNLSIDGKPFRVGKDADGNIGYIVTKGGADTFHPFSSAPGVQVIRKQITRNNSASGSIDLTNRTKLYIRGTYGSYSGGADTSVQVTLDNVLITPSSIYSSSRGDMEQSVALSNHVYAEYDVSNKTTFSYSSSCTTGTGYLYLDVYAY